MLTQIDSIIKIHNEKTKIHEHHCAIANGDNATYYIDHIIRYTIIIYYNTTMSRLIQMSYSV